jgi:H+-transporting ATPase
MVSVIIVVSIVRGDPFLDTLQFALVLTVAAIPVAMPTVLSVTMAVGARLLAKKKAIVSRLVAIEELAGVDVLCTDKTGTLTQNKLTLGDPFAIEGVSVDDVVLAGALASRADDNDTIDLAVLGGLASNQALRGYHVEHFQPFEPVGKRTEATVKAAKGSSFKVTKGAPQVILALSSNAKQVNASVDQAVNEFAARGFRSLGVARAEGNGAWQFLGVLPLFDPPRADAKATIATARQMGVEVKMVTGDALAIAIETARTLGMGTDILDAASLGDTKRTETAAMSRTVESADGYAQVFPEHKYHIVDVLQRRGHIVGMTGDGVNDAPALKKADCGIAVSSATDAARAAASIVLTTPGLSVIIDAIKESRKIFQRMNSYAIYRIAETLRVLLFISLVILIFNFFPVTAMQIVLLALLNDGRSCRSPTTTCAIGINPKPGTCAWCSGWPRSWGRWPRGRLRHVLPRRPRLSPRSPRASNNDVPHALGGRASDDLPGPHPRPLLVHPTGPCPPTGGVGNAGRGDPHRRVRHLHDPIGVALRGPRVGLRVGVVRRDRSREVARVPGVRPVGISC